MNILNSPLFLFDLFLGIQLYSNIHSDPYDDIRKSLNNLCPLLTNYDKLEPVLNKFSEEHTYINI